jgi:ribonuclease HII
MTSRARPDMTLEQELIASGSDCVIGVDEVGRGALAGPVAVGVVVVDAVSGRMPRGLRDSKLLSPAERGRLAPLCAAWVSHHAVGMTSAPDIDALGIIASLGIAACRALGALVAGGFAAGQATILLDGNHDWLTPALLATAGEDEGCECMRSCRVVTRIKADRDCASVAAASVLAKVRRDALMTALSRDAPGYGWSENKGYGTPAHLAALARHGVTRWHRSRWVHPAAAYEADSA